VEALEKLSDSFRCLLSHPRYKVAEKATIKSLLRLHDEKGGLTQEQIRKLGEIYAKYQK